MNFCGRLLCAVAVLISRPAATSVASSPAALVPADAVAYLATSDLPLLDRQWRKTGMSQLWQHEQMEEFLKTFRDNWRWAPNCDIPLPGLRWKQLLRIASGTVCLALIPAEDNQADFLLLADVSATDEQTTALLAELLAEYAKDTTIRHRSAIFANHTAEVFRKHNEGQTNSSFRIYFHHNGIFGVTNREKLARHVLERITKQPTDGLVGQNVFQKVASRSHKAAGDSPIQLTWFLDPWGCEKILRKSNTPDPDTTFLRFKQEGFGIIRAVGGVISIAQAGYDSEHHWFVYAPDAREKAARMLAFFPLDDLQVPDFLPADIGTLRIVGWNLAQALAGYGSWFDAAWAEGEEGTFEAVLDDIRDEPDGPQVDLRGLLDLQQGPVIEIVAPVSANGEDEPQVVYTVNLSNASTVATAVQRMFETDQDVTPTLVGNSTMWVFQSQASNGPGSFGPDLSGYAIGVAQGHLFVATNQSFLERILAKPNATRLVEDKTYRKLAPRIAAKQPHRCIAWQVSFSPAASGTGFGLWHGWADRFAELLSLGPDRLPKLPTAELLGRFTSPGFGFVREWDDGWLFSEYVLARPRLDSHQPER